jgi:hypothetical protein
MAHIEAKIINTGAFMKITIVSVESGFSQMLKNGQWVNTTTEPEKFESELLTFGKSFFDETECEKFMATKIFKSVFQGIKKNWK